MNPARAITSNGVSNLVAPVCALVTAPILARVLGVDGRGQVATATAPLLLLAAAGAFGLPEALTYRYSQGVVSRRQGLWVTTALLILSGFVWFALSILYARTIQTTAGNVVGLVTLASSALPPTLALYGFRNLASAEGRWTAVALEKTVTPIARLIFTALAAAFHGLTPVTAVAIQAFVPLGGIAMYCFAVRAFAEVERPRTAPGLAETARLLVSYGSVVWLGSVSYFLLARLDQLLIPGILGVRELGLYVVAVTVTDPLAIAVAAAKDVIFAEHGRRRDWAHVATVSRTILWVTILGMVVANLLVGKVVPLLFGSEFRQAIEIARILSISQVAICPGLIIGAATASQGRPGLRSIVLLVGASVNVAMILMLSGPWGILGVAWATVFGNLAISISLTFLVQRRSGIPRRLFLLPGRGDVAAIMAKLQRTHAPRHR